MLLTLSQPSSGYSSSFAPMLHQHYLLKFIPSGSFSVMNLANSLTPSTVERSTQWEYNQYCIFS